MSFVDALVGFVAGFVVGAGTLIFYMRWKMMNQLNVMQENMEGMFDLTDEMVDSPGEEAEEREE